MILFYQEQLWKYISGHSPSTCSQHFFFMKVLSFGAGFKKYWVSLLNLYTAKLLKVVCKLN